MKLYLNDTSPFAPYVLVCILEYDLEKPKLIWIDPWKWDTTLSVHNPFSMVPTLELDNKQSLFESTVIVNFLSRNQYIPQSLHEQQIFAYGKILLETSFRYVSLKRHTPEKSTKHPFIERTFKMLEQSLKKLADYEDMIEGTEPKNQAILQLMVALDYSGFRLPELTSRYLSPYLKQKRQSFQQYSSFIKTTPEILATEPHFIQ